MVAASSAIPLEGSTTGALELGLSSRGTSLHNLSFQEADTLVGEAFSVEAGLGRPLQMDLVSVDDVPRHNDRAAGEAFVLNFRLRRGATVSQGTYLFDNARIGKCSLLIAPSGPKGHYSAVINHRRPV
jgi:hypothetical protein